MSCEICNRSSCSRSFHSIEEQEDFDRTPDELIELMEARIDKLESMLDIAWDAVTEAGYEGFDNELKHFMETESK